MRECCYEAMLPSDISIRDERVLTVYSYKENRAISVYQLTWNKLLVVIRVFNQQKTIVILSCNDKSIFYLVFKVNPL